MRALIEGSLRTFDILVLLFIGLLAGAWRFGTPLQEPVLLPLLIGIFLAAHAFAFFDLYRVEHLRRLSFQIPRLLAAWTLTIGLLTSILFGLQASQDVSRLWMATWLVVGGAALVANRTLLMLWLSRSGMARTVYRRAAVIGLGKHLATTLERLAQSDPSLRVTAVLDLDGSLIQHWPKGVSSLAGFADLEDRITDGRIEQVILALPASGGGLLERALRNLRHMPVDGTAVRDYIHVADLATAHVAAMLHLLDGGHSLRLNLATGQGCSVREVIRIGEQVTGRPVPHHLAERRPGDPPCLVADPGGAIRALNWRPARSSLERIVAGAWSWHDRRRPKLALVA